MPSLNDSLIFILLLVTVTSHVSGLLGKTLPSLPLRRLCDRTAQSLRASVLLLQPGVFSVHADESSRWIISVQEIVEADLQFNQPEVDGSNLHNESWCSRSHCVFHDFHFDALSDVRRDFLRALKENMMNVVVCRVTQEGDVTSCSPACSATSLTLFETHAFDN